MVTREFSSAKLADLEEEWVEIGASPWRHGHRKTFVVAADGSYWRFAINVHHEEGWQLDDGETVTATEVHQVERTVKVWEAKS